MASLDTAITRTVHRMAGHMGGRRAYARQAAVASGLVLAAAIVIDGRGEDMTAAFAAPLGAAVAGIGLWNSRPGAMSPDAGTTCIVRTAMLFMTIGLALAVPLTAALGQTCGPVGVMAVAMAIHTSLYHAITDA
jgi:hypothetical protein